MRVLVVALLLAISAVPAAADRPLKPEAQKHKDAALKLYEKSAYAEAAAEFEAALAIDPDPTLVYALAQARRLSGRCDLAVPIYEKYLASHPSEAQTAAARNGVELCEDDLAKARADKAAADKAAADKAAADKAAADKAAADKAALARPAVPDPDPAIGPPEGPGGAREPGPRPWYRRHPIGTALAAGGTIAVGVGVGYLISSRSARKRAEEAEDRDEFLDAIDRANSRRRIGVGALVAGTALVTAGVLAFVLGRDDPEPALSAGTDGTTVFVWTTF